MTAIICLLELLATCTGSLPLIHPFEADFFVWFYKRFYLSNVLQKVFKSERYHQNRPDIVGSDSLERINMNPFIK